MDNAEFITNLARLAKRLISCGVPHDRITPSHESDLCLRTRDDRLVVRLRPPRIELDGDVVDIDAALDAVLVMGLRRAGDLIRLEPWSTDVPDSPYVLVWASDVGAYFLLRADDTLLPGVRYWWREGLAKVYNRGNLEQCATRSGWRYTPIELPSPPADDEWEDA